jgi:predicted CxxxxCH...CXXCH cytochrome family protein
MYSASSISSRRGGDWWLLALLASLLSGCTEEREHTALAPVYQQDIDRLLASRCLACHDGADAGGGFRLGSYLDVLSCPTNNTAPAPVAVLNVLDRPDHSALLSASERSRLEAFVRAGAPLQRTGVHASGVLNPRSRDWHGRLAAQDHFGPIKDPTHPGACGRCHAGAPVQPEGIRFSAPGAPDCTSCHRAPEGVVACGTCHGDGNERAYPPRDACWFPAARTDAHRAHVTSERLASAALTCTTCHPAADASLSASHADGKVDVQFDERQAGQDAHYDPVTGQCAVSCHGQGGARAVPAFTESGPFGCNDCHRAPPDNHYAGTCDHCHIESNANGSALTARVLHMNGRVDVGDGSNSCGACHGQADDPAPATASHRLHSATRLSAAIECADCHQVPQEVRSPGHLDMGSLTPADVIFGSRASARDQRPTYENRTCRAIACHGAGLPENIERALQWDMPSSGACTGCHGIPPTRQHPSDSSCATLVCHGAEVSVGTPLPSISESGRGLHINGVIDPVHP